MASWLLSVFLLSTLLLAALGERRAVVNLEGEDSGVTGKVFFSQADNGGPVRVSGTVSGLSRGKHGFHVHEKGDLSNGCSSLGEHFNPDQKNHGDPNHHDRHTGDLGNIFAESNGKAQISKIDTVISLTGKYSIIGRGVVVHTDADDLGRGGFNDSLTTGHSGGRVACGVIGIM